MKIAIVAPCHIPPTKDWITSLQREARHAQADVIIVDDSDGNLGELPDSFRVFDYVKQQEFLGELYVEFADMFHKSSASRIFGHLLAYKEGYDAVIGLDSDCIVPFNFVEQHIANLGQKKGFGWSNPLGNSGWYPRGYPYFMRNWRVVANMGLWDNVLDMNGKDRNIHEPRHLNANSTLIAAAPIPFSGMNFMLAREALLGFLFLPNFTFEKHVTTNENMQETFTRDEFRRIDDIWGGYIFQRLAQKLHESVSYGAPVVFHDTVVVPEEDAKEEAAMYKWEQEFIEAVDRATNFIPNPGADYIELFEMFVGFFERETQGIFNGLIPSLKWWLKAIKWCSK